MKNTKVITELESRCHDCGNKLPQGRGKTSFYCRLIGLCRYCYRHKFPQHRRKSVMRPDGPYFLSYGERRRRERKSFDVTLWSPEFYDEWMGYWAARRRGVL